MKRRQYLLHPLLFAVFPVISLVAANIDIVALGDAYRSIFIIIAVTVVLLLVFRFITKDWPRAALLASLLLVLFFSYGHVYSFFKNTSILGLIVGRHRFLLSMWVLLFFGVGWLVWRRLANVEVVTRVVNLAATGAILLPGYTVLTNLAIQPSLGSTGASAQQVVGAGEIGRSQDERLPDLYYIVLDSYARQDVLKAIYNFDNSPFLDHLEEKGFLIGRRSRSNYGQTTLSLASAMNFDYVDAFAGPIDSQNGDLSRVIYAINKSELRAILESMGYRMIAFASGYPVTEVTDADYFISLENEVAGTSKLLGTMANVGNLNQFEAILLHSSASLFLIDATSSCPANLPDLLGSQSGDIEDADQRLCSLVNGFISLTNSPFETQRERILFTFDKLVDLPDVGGPRFVFVHIVAPHFPFVLGPDGEMGQYARFFPLGEISGPGRTRENYLNGYRDQLTYVNKRMQAMIDTIIAQSETPPIIIIQSDHGPDANMVGNEPTPVGYLVERYSILNAYYLPGCSPVDFYDSITPVNSFRMVMNACFGAQYELLEDRVYHSKYDSPFEFEDVTEDVTVQ